MSKKQKRATPRPAPTRRQLSKWERQAKIRRIVIIVSVVLIAALVTMVSVAIYGDRVAPWREVVVKVNDASIRMGQYVDMLEFQSYLMNDDDEIVYQIADGVLDSMINSELIRQKARELGIMATSQEIDEKIREYEMMIPRWPDEDDWPSPEVGRDMIRAEVLWEKLVDRFDAELPDMEQAHVQVMLVESEAVGEEVLSAIQAGGNFTILVDEYSYHPQIGGDLGWLPEELMPNPIIADAALNMTAGEVHGPIHDATAVKNLGYWLIEVTDIMDEEEVPQVNARAILLGSEAEAEQLRDELVVGNFTALAMEYSQHDSGRDGGELGWLEPGDMGSTAFDEVAFDLPTEVVSEPVRDEAVQTTGGYWIIDVIDRESERALEGEARETMASRELVDSFEEWREESTIDDRLDDEKQYWAIREVLRRR